MGGELTDKQKRKIRKILDPDYGGEREEEEGGGEEFTALEECEREEFGAESQHSTSPFDEDSDGDDPFEGSFFGHNPNFNFYQGNGFGPRNGGGGGGGGGSSSSSNVQCSQM
ncbi:hypothetical protein TrRE_jg4245 [Triparma retinervis]|uniref:Uncharacterized protein n=1 Tax=Triparma retinervis TaxID=2557542 RepID=A0A9W6ZE61_9STRA|nr:hypothetical protein TrRE_jg4245 [Triparma retinervis]